jgi:hypothetical protein
MNSQNVVAENRKKELRPQEKAFCLNYLANPQNAAQSYVDAGYSPNGAKVSAHKMLQKPHIKEFIQAKFKKMEEKLEITAEWKMKMLRECVERCSSGDADKDGKLHPSGLIGAIAELNKMQGHLAPTKSENTHKHGLDTELMELVDKYDKEY